MTPHRPSPAGLPEPPVSTGSPAPGRQELTAAPALLRPIAPTARERNHPSVPRAVALPGRSSPERRSRSRSAEEAGAEAGHRGPRAPPPPAPAAAGCPAHPAHAERQRPTASGCPGHPLLTPPPPGAPSEPSPGARPPSRELSSLPRPRKSRCQQRLLLRSAERPLAPTSSAGDKCDQGTHRRGRQTPLISRGVQRPFSNRPLITRDSRIPPRIQDPSTNRFESRA